jgi:hypothetical protein
VTGIGDVPPGATVAGPALLKAPGVVSPTAGLCFVLVRRL